MNNISSFDKIESLNSNYLSQKIRYLYLDLNIINDINKIIDKRRYLAYYIAKIYNCTKNFKNDFKLFVNRILKNINAENFIENFIKEIINKNNEMIQKDNEDVPFYIIIDNIYSDKSYKVIEKLLKYENDLNIFGIIDINSEFGQKKFISLNSKKYSDRGYIKLDITEDINNCLTILNIEFKSKEIKNKFIQNYKNILIQYLNNANNKINDKILENLFSDVNGSFFEKQIILDILLNKIKNQNNKNLKFIELKVHSIYCINSNIKNIKKFKDKNIILTQESKTGEIYDFGIIIGS